jgi:glycosyltransferase involved in cell wall biosynthesis
MRVAFDVSALRAPQTGVGTYTANLLEHLRCVPQLDMLPIAQPEMRWPLPGDSRPPTLRMNKTLWLQTVLPLHLARVAADVCHFTNSVAPCWTPCPSVLTIHDMTLWLLPKYHPRRRILAMRPFIPFAARRAKAIIAVSASTKRDVVRTLNVPEKKVHVIHEAAAPHFRPVPRTTLDGVRQRYGLPASFILYVGTIEPRKNLPRLLAAFDIVRRSGYSSHGLVLAGSRGWGESSVLSSMERLGLNGSIQVLGYVPSDALVALYNLADALVFPSHYEGFGLPVMEAMACGTPVVTSPNGSLAEIAGGAAELIDPTDPESIAAGLQRVLADSQRRAEMRTAGLARAAQFSWSRVAAQTGELYASVLRS